MFPENQNKKLRNCPHCQNQFKMAPRPTFRLLPISSETLHKSIWRVLLQHMDLHMMRFLVSAEFCGRLTHGSLSAGKHRVSDHVITWPPFISHIPVLPHISPWNQTYQRFLVNAAWSCIREQLLWLLSVSRHLSIYLFTFSNANPVFIYTWEAIIQAALTPRQKQEGLWREHTCFMCLGQTCYL